MNRKHDDDADVDDDDDDVYVVVVVVVVRYRRRTIAGHCLHRAYEPTLQVMSFTVFIGYALSIM